MSLALETCPTFGSGSEEDTLVVELTILVSLLLIPMSVSHTDEWSLLGHLLCPTGCAQRTLRVKMANDSHVNDL